MTVSAFVLRSLLLIALAGAVLSVVQIRNLQVDPCEPNVDYPVTLHDIVVSFQGKSLILAGGVNVARDLVAPIKVAVIIRLSLVSFRQVIEIPCNDGFGSCTYKDICTLAEKLNKNSDSACSLLESFGLPCQCPIPKGTYDLSRTEIPIDTSLISSLSGSYGLQVNGTHNGQPLGCYQITFSMS